MAATLKRRLGLLSAVMITVGSVIGSGIFLKPLAIAQSLPSPDWIYACWAGLGIVCLLGSFAYAELGAMFPEAGGQYAFLRAGWGRFVAFLYGWTLLLVVNTGTLAALGHAFASNLGRVFPALAGASHAIGIGMILFLAIINHVGVGWGAVVQNVATVAKLVVLAAIVVGGFALVAPTAAVGPAATMPGSAPASVPAGPVLHDTLTLGGLVAACLAMFWAYEGWYQLPFNAAELRRPERDLPRGLVLGLLVIVVAYVTVNVAYFHVVPFDELRRLSPREAVPQTTVGRIFGDAAGHSALLLVALSVFGAANPNLLSSPRAFYAMAVDGMMPRLFTRVSPRHGTPSAAIWAQALWAIGLMLFFPGFDELTDYVIFASLIFYALTVAAVIALRIREPQRPRPFRCWGYPVTPVVFIVVLVAVDVVTLIEHPGNALKGAAVIAAGVPAYFLIARRGAAA